MLATCNLLESLVFNQYADFSLVLGSYLNTQVGITPAYLNVSELSLCKLWIYSSSSDYRKTPEIQKQSDFCDKIEESIGSESGLVLRRTSQTWSIYHVPLQGGLNTSFPGPNTVVSVDVLTVVHLMGGGGNMLILKLEKLRNHTHHVS